MAFVVLILIAIVILAAAIFAIRSFGQSSAPSARSGGGSTASAPQVGPEVVDFHVKGDTASATFNVPLGDGDAGQHLIDLLSHAAVEHVRHLASEGLPLDGVAHITVSGMRAGSPHQVATVDLPDVGILPEPVDLSMLQSVDHDPIGALAAVVADASVTSAPPADGTLESVSDFIELTAPTEARLRTVGVDTSTMSHSDLCHGLVKIGGYIVDDAANVPPLVSAPGAEVLQVTKSGQRIRLVILSQVEGDYPEVDDSVLAELAVLTAQPGVDKVMLLTDKFSPYSMYERERRSDSVIFVTRERLQAFVDSFGMDV